MTGPQIGTSQNKQPDENKPLPLFRKDLQLIKGPQDPDGSPTFNLYDPVRSRYYGLAWYEAAILDCLQPGMTLPQLAAALTKKTSVNVTVKDLEAFFYDARLHNLLDVPHSSEELSKEVESKEVDPLTWAIFHYLYIRIPLLKPDAFLTRTLPYVQFLASKPAIILYLFIMLSGFFMLMMRFDEFLNTFTYFFNWKGLIAYSIAIMFTKVFHELGHAYVAKNYGLHIPTMGAALIIMWPVMYTDASDIWKLESRRQRFAISIAGVMVELVIAGLATWGWYFSEAGIFQSICFLLASSTWMTSLLVNMNPCMRFDGYYLLCDIWGIDNLQTRSYGIARWKLRELFLGIQAPPPEIVSRRRMIGMIVYSLATWVYRLFLYISIAIIIYLKFTKVLGIILFFVEIGIFIIWPIVSEVKDLYKVKSVIRFNKRLAATVTVLAVALAWFVLPMPHTLAFDGVTVPVKNQDVYIPYSGTIEKIYVNKGESVTAGQPLLTLYSEELNAEIKAAKLDIEMARKEVEIASFDKTKLATIASKRAEIQALYSRYRALEEQKNVLTVHADLTGTIYDWDQDIYEGRSVKKDFVIGKIAPLDVMKVIAYVPEDEVQNIQVGQEINFQLVKNFENVKGKIERIRVGRNVELEYKQLASVYGGDLPTKSGAEQGSLELVESYYVIDIFLIDPPSDIAIGQLGVIEVKTHWRSRFLELLERIEKIFYRESGV